MDVQIGVRKEPKVFSSFMKDYSLEWHNQMISHGFSCVARDEGGRSLPHCGVLSVGGGLVIDFFEVRKKDEWCYSVYVFESNDDLAKWVVGFGPDRVSDIYYVVGV